MASGWFPFSLPATVALPAQEGRAIRWLFAVQRVSSVPRQVPFHPHRRTRDEGILPPASRLDSEGQGRDSAGPAACSTGPSPLRVSGCQCGL